MATILIIDDLAANREFLVTILRHEGHRLIEGADGAEGLAAALLLTDVVMPGTSGPELAGRLAELRPGLKVIYMSGYTEETVVHHGVIDAGIAFLHKPFTAEALGRKLNETLGGTSESAAGPSSPGNRLQIA